jgi:PAS domain S-box-containing protein
MPRSGDGDAIIWDGIVLDVTGRKQAEDSLRASEERFRTAFLGSGVGMAVISTESRLLEVNAAFAEFLGCRPDEIVGRDKLTFTHPDDAEVTRETIRRVLASETPSPQLEKRYVRPDGRVVWGLVSLSLLRHADGSPAHLIAQVQDVTARREADALLRRSQEMLTESQTIARLGSWSYDVESGSVEWSDETFRLYEWPKELGAPSYAQHLEMFAPESRTLLTRAVEQAIRDGEPYRVELQAVLPSATTRWVEGRGWAQRDAAGRVARLTGTVQDITARVEAETALRESERRFRGVFDSMLHFIGLLSPEGTVLEFNRPALEFGGQPAEAVIGRPVWEMSWWSVTPTAREWARAAVGRACAGEVVREEVEVVCAGGVRAIVDFSLKALRDEEGRVVLVIPEGRDITARKKSEEALRASEERYRFLADSIPNLIWVSDPAGNPEMLNHRWHEYTGMTEQAAMSGRWYEALHPDDRPAVVSRWDEALAAGTPFGTEYRLHRHDGAYRWHLARAVPMKDAEGRVVRWFGTGTDVHDLREAEERVRSTLRQREVLLQEVHHRVKNNLQVICSLLRLQSRGSTDPLLLSALRESRDRVASMALVHESLYQSGDLSRVGLDEYVRKLTRSLGQSYSGAASRVRVRVDAEPIWLEIDQAVPVGLILNELIANSFKHAFPDGQPGEVVVSFGRADRGLLVLSVADDGVGMVEPFASRSGSSLGLYASHKLSA